jgi:hypothetical protein
VDRAALARLAARRWGEDFGIVTVLSALRSSTGRGLKLSVRVCKLWGEKELVFFEIGHRGCRIREMKMAQFRVTRGARRDLRVMNRLHR